MKSPIYDIDKSIEYNREYGPFYDGPLPKRACAPKELWHDFMGFRVASCIGSASCPLTSNARGVALAAKLGYDIITYKTTRSVAHQAHPWPNLVFVNTPKQFSKEDVKKPITKRGVPPISIDDLVVTNSIGNAAPELSKTMEQIQLSRQAISDGQVLIVSVFSSVDHGLDLIEDFVTTACAVKDAGAQIVEVNLSCPNVAKGGAVYLDPELTFRTCDRVVRALPTTPVIIKVGLFPDVVSMNKTMVAAARAGIWGIAGLNSISMQVVDKKGEPLLGKNRRWSGVCGAPLRNLGLEFTRDVVAINKKEKLDLTVIGMGGVTQPEHFDLYLEAGADAALSGAAAMFDPTLAERYHILRYNLQSKSLRMSTEKGGCARL